MNVKFWAGVICGVLIGVAGSAVAATIQGNNGYLMGWEVTGDDGKICDDPYIWVGIREIECD